jgi:hypothetical protein
MSNSFGLGVGNWELEIGNWELVKGQLYHLSGRVCAIARLAQLVPAVEIH